MSRGGVAYRILRGEALIGVLVAAQDDIGARGLKRLPERLDLGVVAVLGTRAESRGVPIRQRAGIRVSGEVGAQPGLLRGPRGATPNRRAVGVERDQVPRSKVVA